jgi:protein-disulfide isomerase
MSKSSSRRSARKRRQQPIALVLGLVVVAAMVVGLIATLQSPKQTKATDIRSYADFPQGVDETGAPYLGDPDAPVTLVLYSDFACPYCRIFAQETLGLLVDEYVAGGQLRVIFKPMQFDSPTSPVAAAAGLCAAEQGKFWEMHDGLFDIAYSQGYGGFSGPNLRRLAGELGLDEGEFTACLGSVQTRTTLLQVQNEADDLGVTGTPTIFVNGQRIQDRSFGALSALIESLLQ